jgi:hypothetical protein
MLLPTLKNTTALAVIPETKTVHDLIRASTKNLQRVAELLPGSGAVGGVVYLNFDGISGVYKLNKEVIDPSSFGRILVPYHGMWEGMIEWGNGSKLQNVQRQLLGVDYEEKMSENLFKKPLSPSAYRKENDGVKFQLGFLGYALDEDENISYGHSSNGALKAVNALATTAMQALAAFGEMVHPVIELSSTSWEGSYRTIYEPEFKVVGYVTDKKAREASVLSDDDIITRPTASKAKLNREKREAPAI